MQTVQMCCSHCGRMEVMGLGWQLCWCQGGGARLTANVQQCVIQSTGRLTLCAGALHIKSAALK